MKCNFKLLFFIITILAIGCSSKNKENKSRKTKNDYSAKIDSLIQTASPRKFNGVISVTRNGEAIYTKAYGYSNFEEKTPISLQDNFRIQSNSKQVTAILILKEVEKGNINLNSSIKKYLPDLQVSWTDSVTVHQLLNNSSGVASLDEPLLFKPGTDFHYSNPGYGLLGRIIKHVTDKEYAEVANNLFQELGMKNTYCYEMDKENKGLINGFIQSNNKFNLLKFRSLGFTKESWTNFVPAGGIISNLTDLQIWDSKLHNGEILNNSTYELMTNSNVVDTHEAFSEQKFFYGYGININLDDPITYLGHAGTGIGFASLKIYIPEKKVNLIILENVFNSDMKVNYHFEKEIRKIILNSSLLE